jgi:hypothetical protein
MVVVIRITSRDDHLPTNLLLQSSYSLLLAMWLA